MNSFLSKEELKDTGFKSVGDNVLISRKASFYNVSNISIGSNVRIDDFCILSGEILLESNIHISAYCALYGSKKIIMESYTGLSPRTTLFTEIDDFAGPYLIGSMVEDDFRNIKGGQIYICKFAQIGANSIVFPNLTVSEGATVGALSLVNKSLEKWSVYAGVPAVKIKNRLRHDFTFST
jgi:galactoside O-acetyltransferase